MSEVFEKAKEISSKIYTLQSELNDELLSIAIENSPYKKGDKVVIRGYSHNGKIGIINKIGPASFSRFGQKKYICQLSGQVLKKDGTTGQHFFKFDLEEGEK